ncbi:MAG: mandelate racemase/muconate lactonizing enzyme family protein [Dehalococcoidia bacterium]|nr:mandelate racemase/muconate lactonizing enzyme family protein [Dehalococcoidia bacterium]
MRIKHIETVRVSDPADAIWLRVHTDTGLIGLGETWYASKTVESAVHDHFAPLIVGRDPFAIERHWLNMFRLSDHAGYGGAELRAISAIDMALWDIKGQAAGVPVYELLGGAVRKKIRVYATGAPFEGCGELARELIDDGLIAMKMGPTIPVATPSEGQYLAPKDLDRGLKPFRDVRDAVGGDIKIANDGHGKWALPVAIQIAKEMESLDIMWQEDLMPLLNPDALRQLQEATSTPVCISERLLTRWQLREFIENGAAQIVMPDLIWTGGISETHRIAVMASAHQVPVAPHDATGPVNIFACAHICMNSPNAMIMEHVRPYLYGWYGDIVDPLPPIEHGWLSAPQEPGIGTRLRPEVLERPDCETRVTDESVAIPGMNDEGWAGGDNFSEKMWADMEEIREFRSLGSSSVDRPVAGTGDAPTGGPGGGIATWYQNDGDSADDRERDA